jgi:hypothetical protein
MPQEGPKHIRTQVANLLGHPAELCPLSSAGPSPRFTPETNLPLKDFVESIYLPFIESETRASTKKGYREIWNNHICDRVGNVRLREFRTVHASKMLRAIARRMT